MSDPITPQAFFGLLVLITVIWPFVVDGVLHSASVARRD